MTSTQWSAAKPVDVVQFKRRRSVWSWLFICLFVVVPGWLLWLRLGGAVFKGDQNPFGAFFLSPPVLATIVALALVATLNAFVGLPALRVTRDTVELQLAPGLRRRIDLRGLGTAYAGHASVPVKLATIYFYTMEHERALSAAGKLAPPDQHTCDREISVQMVTGGNDAYLRTMVEAINDRRTRAADGVDVGTSAKTSSDIARKIGRRRTFRIAGFSLLVAIAYVAEQVMTGASLRPTAIAVMFTVGVFLGAAYWGQSTGSAFLRPFVVVVDFVARYKWWAIAGLLVGALVYGWLR